ncbi:MAG: leucyl aminopeptidase, partial [Planctomycetes bacterium]|nr:leucyl aminopeptidase [Planctomycetota bacterium]
MKIRLVAAKAAPSTQELLVAFVNQGKTPDLGRALAKFVGKAQATGDLSTDERAANLFYPDASGQPKRVLFVGLGKAEQRTTEKLRRAAAVAQKRAEALRVGTFRLLVSDADLGDVEPTVAGRALAEGLILGAYRYEKPTGEKAKARHAQRVELCYGGKGQKAFAQGVELGRIGAEATVFSRDLENLPGNLATPTVLAREAKKLQGANLTVKVLDEAAMAKLKMGALLGVARGSVQPPKLIVMDYKPAGYKSTVCIVGKGLTFDTGGISIKPSAKMDEMRYDM